MTIDAKIISYSQENKQALHYTKTHEAPYRYLGYRDIPHIIRRYHSRGLALDYGSGTGYSTQFLHNLGFKVVGADLNEDMVHQACLQCPNFAFYHIKNGVLPFENSTFNLVFSAFVLLEISSEEQMINYLLEAKRVMKAGFSVLIALTGSEHLHDASKKWLDFSSDFPENKDLRSGNLVKLYHYDSQIEFSDYYWTQRDYQNCFKKAGLNLLEVHFPLVL